VSASGKPVEPDVAAMVNDEDIAPVDTEDGRDELHELMCRHEGSSTAGAEGMLYRNEAR
jgi:hypothetical protein